MATPKKAKRGKHRWVAISTTIDTSREDLDIFFSQCFDGVEIRVFDIIKSINSTNIIVKVPLPHYRSFLKEINDHSDYYSITSSGKIRLVRSRMLGLG